MQRLTIINYGSGNLHSAAKAFERAARESEADVAIAVTDDPAAVLAADRVVLPGVGAFADCKAGVDRVAGMREALERTVRDKLRPFLGICVGAQLTAERGLEFGVTPNSSPRSAVSCAPTQIPRNGRSLSRTVLSSASRMPTTRSTPALQSAKAPTPGSTTRSAARTAAGSPVTEIATSASLSRAARSKALAAEWRLPEP